MRCDKIRNEVAKLFGHTCVPGIEHSECRSEFVTEVLAFIALPPSAIDHKPALACLARGLRDVAPTSPSIRSLAAVDRLPSALDAAPVIHGVLKDLVGLASVMPSRGRAKSLGFSTD